jgi:hypothetical protein
MVTCAPQCFGGIEKLPTNNVYVELLVVVKKRWAQSRCCWKRSEWSEDHGVSAGFQKDTLLSSEYKSRLWFGHQSSISFYVFQI